MNYPRIKVLAIIPSAFCYGLQHISVELLGHARSNIDTHFLITRWTDGEFEELINKYGFSYSFCWLGMFSRKLDPRNLKMSLHALSKIPKLYWDFWKVCRVFRPQVIFFANHHELILLTPMLWLSRSKVICHIHDPSPPIRFQQLSFAYYGKRVDLFIAISENVKKRLLQLGNVSNKTTVVHNGVSLPEHHFENREKIFQYRFNWPEDAFIVGLTGQMTATKGHEDLLEAFSCAHVQNPKIKLVIGGKPIEPFYSLLQKRVQELGLTEVVAFTGWQPDASVFYRNIDLFVLASRHEEGYGLVVAEAMAFGRPTVITASGGAVEIVDNGVTGYVVGKNNISELTSNILRLSQAPELCRKFGRAGRARVQQNFSIDLAARNFVSSIFSVLNQ